MIQKIINTIAEIATSASPLTECEQWASPETFTLVQGLNIALWFALLGVVAWVVLKYLAEKRG